MIFQLAVNVISSSGIVVGISAFHPANVYHSLVGLAGTVIAVQYSCWIGLTALHQLLLNVIICVLIFQLAVNVISSSGIVSGRLGVHPANVYPSLVGAVGTVIGVP